MQMNCASTSSECVTIFSATVPEDFFGRKLNVRVFPLVTDAKFSLANKNSYLRAPFPSKKQTKISSAQIEGTF